MEILQDSFEFLIVGKLSGSVMGKMILASVKYLSGNSVVELWAR